MDYLNTVLGIGLNLGLGHAEALLIDVDGLFSRLVVFVVLDFLGRGRCKRLGLNLLGIGRNDSAGEALAMEELVVRWANGAGLVAIESYARYAGLDGLGGGLGLVDWLGLL